MLDLSDPLFYTSAIDDDKKSKGIYSRERLYLAQQVLYGYYIYIVDLVG